MMSHHSFSHTRSRFSVTTISRELGCSFLIDCLRNICNKKLWFCRSGGIKIKSVLLLRDERLSRSGQGVMSANHTLLPISHLFIQYAAYKQL